MNIRGQVDLFVETSLSCITYIDLRTQDIAQPSTRASEITHIIIVTVYNSCTFRSSCVLNENRSQNTTMQFKPTRLTRLAFDRTFNFLIEDFFSDEIYMAATQYIDCAVRQLIYKYIYISMYKYIYINVYICCMYMLSCSQIYMDVFEQDVAQCKTLEQH